VLKSAGLLDRKWCKPSKKGTGFHQPSKPHAHWHIDVTYINIAGTFFYLTTVLDGYSRYIVHWEIKESMTEKEIELIIERARERFPGVSPRIISDNGPQFIAKDFKDYVRLCGMTHVRTSPFYPQSNGKIEAWHKTLKRECIRPSAPRSFEEAERYIAEFVDEYNGRRLHSGIGYVAPVDKLRGNEGAIFALRNARLEAARIARRELPIQAQVPINATVVHFSECTTVCPSATPLEPPEVVCNPSEFVGEITFCYSRSA
jgi:transposase InsO family protein